MFTGLVSAIGTIREISGENTRCILLSAPYAISDLPLGASVACNGICLTVTHTEALGEKETLFGVDLSGQTLSLSAARGWKTGDRINLELALRVGDALGGHLVSGHVDGIAELVASAAHGEAHNYTLRSEEPLMRFIAAQGSVTLDGVSLTVTWTKENDFGVTLIPHTLSVTNWKDRVVGDQLNLEVDLIARYVKRLLERQ